VIDVAQECSIRINLTTLTPASAPGQGWVSASSMLLHYCQLNTCAGSCEGKQEVLRSFLVLVQLLDIVGAI
jgi:hypothetical protein